MLSLPSAISEALKKAVPSPTMRMLKSYGNDSVSSSLHVPFPVETKQQQNCNIELD